MQYWERRIVEVTVCFVPGYGGISREWSFTFQPKGCWDFHRGCIMARTGIRCNSWFHHQ